MTIASDRIPCINPRCRRTAPAAKYEPGEEIICGKCFRALPMQLRARYRKAHRDNQRMLRLVKRRIARGTVPPHVLDRLHGNMLRRFEGVWDDIKRRFSAPDVPAGLENLLAEVGLQ
jgi:hypothetical protein